MFTHFGWCCNLYRTMCSLSSNKKHSIAAHLKKKRVERLHWSIESNKNTTHVAIQSMSLKFDGNSSNWHDSSVRLIDIFSLIRSGAKRSNRFVRVTGEQACGRHTPSRNWSIFKLIWKEKVNFVRFCYKYWINKMLLPRKSFNLW